MRYFIKCFKRTDSDSIVAKLFILTWRFAVSHMAMHYYAPSHRVAWSVGLSVALSVCPCKNGWNDQVAIWVQDSDGPNEPRITWGPDAIMGMGNFGGNRQTIVKYRDTPRSSVQTRLNWSRCRLGCGFAWDQNHVLHRSPDPPLEGAFWRTGAPTVNYRHFLPSAVQKGLNRSIYRLGF